MSFRFCVLSFVVYIFPLCSSAENIDIHAYGLLPKARSLAISPDGNRLAFIQRDDQIDYFVLMDSRTFEIYRAINTESLKARSVVFLTNEKLLLRVSETKKRVGVKHGWEDSRAFIYDIETGNYKPVFNSKKILPAQSGLGVVSGFNANKQELYVPAYGIRGSYPSYNLYRIGVSSGSLQLHAKGRLGTLDWFVGADGKALVRVDYDVKANEYRIFSRATGDWVRIYTEKMPFPNVRFQGLSRGLDSLIYVERIDGSDTVKSLNLISGESSVYAAASEPNDLAVLITDINRQLLGVKHTGYVPRYEMDDQRIDKKLERLVESYPGSSVHFVGASDDREKIIVRISGADVSRYVLSDSGEARTLFSQYPDVKDGHVGALKAVRIKGRDGLNFPAVITFPSKVSSSKKPPAIVIPHGVLRKQDSLEFDWLAQYLSAKGYVVIQPNFRSFKDFSYEFVDISGRRWVKEMWNDTTDALKAMVDLGEIDAERVCILGFSYGGYSALSGGAFTPNLYRCIISVNGVSDLHEMLDFNSQKNCGRHWLIEYWNHTVANLQSDEQLLKRISPSHSAVDFIAPVLLIHGKDDTIVPIQQSKIMLHSLNRVENPVQFVALDGADHWLSSSHSRLTVLKEIERFLDHHNPVH